MALARARLKLRKRLVGLEKAQKIMKSILLAALALPVILLTGCASGPYYGYDDGPGYYGPGY